MTVVAWDRTGDRSQIEIVDGVEHEFILHGGGYRSAGLVIWYVRWVFRLFIHLLGSRPTVVWAANFETALPAALAGIFTRVPFVYYIHDNVCMTYHYPLITWMLLRPLDRFVVGRSSAVIVPDASRVERHIAAHSRRVSILPNSPASSLRPGELDCVGPARQYDVYVTGSLWESRGVLRLLDAVSAVPECRVLVAGSVYEEAVGVAIKRSSNVTYVGCVDHLEALRLYTQAKSVLAFYDPRIPINVSASPTKLYEAMMMGSPVIVNCEVMLSQKVTLWDTGYTCHYADTGALVDLLRHIMSNPDEAAEKGERARAVFESELSWERMEPTLFGIIDAVCAEAEL